MQAALMVPCYIDMFYPHAGIATLELLEKLGVDVVYPQEQTCGGQPMANKVLSHLGTSPLRHLQPPGCMG